MKQANSLLIDHLREKFNAVANNFLCNDKNVNDHIELKRNHTFRVCEEIRSITESLALNEDDRILAEIIALLHDIGRFEQFYRYKTFNDRKSVNHAELSVQTLKSNQILDNFGERWKEIIIFSILNHNTPFITSSDDKKKILFTKLIRDADKLDIWNVLLDDELRRIIENDGVQVSYTVPDEIFNCFRKSNVVLLSLSSSPNDSKLVRISWIFDINFKYSFKEIEKRNIVNRLFSQIPDSSRLNDLKEIVQTYIQKKINN